MTGTVLPKRCHGGWGGGEGVRTTENEIHWFRWFLGWELLGFATLVDGGKGGTALQMKGQWDCFCSATAATNYPSLRDPPNGCQGHLRPCLWPPDRPLVTEPDSNDVRTRSTFIQLLA